MSFTSILFALVLLCIYFYLTRNYDYWKKQNVPCAPNAIPGIGHILSLLLVRDNLAMWIEKQYRKMGKFSMYGCYFMQTPALVIRDPELIKSVFNTNFTNFQNNMIKLHKDLDPILIKNPFFARDEHWKESRAMLGSNFSGKRLRYLFSTVIQVCAKFTNYVDRYVREKSDFVELELKDLFARITGEMVANAAFGIEGQSFEDAPDHQAFTNVAKSLFEPTKMNGLEQATRFYLPNFADRIGLSFIPKETDYYFRKNIRAVVKSRLQNGEVRRDCLQGIIEEMDAYDENAVVEQATSLFFDGYETSSSVLSFVIYRLAENSHIQDKARAEVRLVLEKFNNSMSYEAVKNMHYLEQVLCEAMRLNPALGDFAKVCNKETVLWGSDKLTCRLKPGDIVLISGMGLHMDEEYWPNPMVFDPERFNVVNRTERNKYTYLAFGEGPRICIGKRMGIMVVKIVTAIILQNYLLEASPKTKLPFQLNPNTFASIVKGGLWVRFKPLGVKH